MTWQGNDSEIRVFGFIVNVTSYTAALRLSLLIQTGLFKVEILRHVLTAFMYAVAVYAER